MVVIAWATFFLFYAAHFVAAFQSSALQLEETLCSRVGGGEATIPQIFARGWYYLQCYWKRYKDCHALW
jgi:hypothetical protein